MVELISNNLVRFAALLSFIAMVSGYSFGDDYMILLEICMIAIWLHMDYKKIASFFQKRG